MSSGVGVSPECLTTYQELKLGKKTKWIVYAMNKAFTEVVVEKTGETDLEDLIAQLPGSEPRWAVLDFGYESGEGKRNKICFISWSPDDSKIKQKMVYASSKDALRKSLVGVHAEIQATSYEELDPEVVHERVAKRI
ncbi:actin depolymerizing factor [Sistotremastrum niveocremeum HHB9708]|uniref:Cofilin n=2 Tax=Sistotremastraceae TaxID=3402574 RepID=A0A164XEP0_9AGAM|nr:actin depolymerizing factor [Sistotremastrum niveocremeum HHB9708]KZT41379.1 hypothetical protein SISSUDRAFT_305558 [Sistotremastrum suecicum HHB10207 ss-3]